MPVWRRELWRWNALPQWIAHQSAWWCCLLIMGWAGALCMLAFVLLHLSFNRETLRRELALIGAAMVLGLLLDNALGSLELVRYQGRVHLGYAPVWLVGLWAGLGATLAHSQVAMIRSLPRALLVGALGGPLAYLGGASLERLYVQGSAGLAATSLAWALVLAALHLVWARFTGSAVQSAVPGAVPSAVR